MGFELLHAGQAIDLRKMISPTLKLGRETDLIYTKFRQHVPFLVKDRPLAPDIKKSYLFIRSYSLDP